MTQPEDTNVTYQTHKIGRAATLLSLDSVLPFYPFIEVPTTEPQTYKIAIREAILENRKKFAANPVAVPDLHAAIKLSFEKNIGSEAIRKFHYWLKNIFVYGSGEYRLFSSYELLLLAAKNTDDRWNALELPICLSELARNKFILLLDKQRLIEVDDKLAEKELSEWDMDMYARHGLNEEFKTPWNQISLSFGQLRYRQFMGWLLPQLTQDDLEIFYQAATRQARLHKLLSVGETMPHPRTQILPDPALD